MNWDFRTADELLRLCAYSYRDISDVMLAREMQLGETDREEIMGEIDRCLRVMNVAVDKAISDPAPSMGGFLGGEAQKLNSLDENNASMGVIVAAPTAGAAGVLPAVLLSVYQNCDISIDTLRKGLINASAIGYLLTRNGSVSGAEAGCQAEVGSASAMAASALTEMLGGTPEQCCNAAAIALSNLLGLVCDPVRGLVEVPCQTRNTIGAAGALTAAELALAGITVHISLDEMIRITSEVGRSLPESLRETAKGGCAGACDVCLGSMSISPTK